MVIPNLQEYFEDLRADISKAKKVLNWEPEIGYRELTKIMMDADLRALGLETPGGGDEILQKYRYNWIGSHVDLGLKELVPSSFPSQTTGA